MKDSLDSLCAQAELKVREGTNILVLSDRAASAERIPIPSLLACAAVHHHLIREGLRTSVGLVVESGEPREVHHFACLAGYGAEAIRSEEHTSELQSRLHLVCRLLLEKKKD